MPRFADIVVDQTPQETPIVGAFVTVKNADGSLAAITLDNGSTIANSVCIADSKGAYYFNAAAGVYTLEFRLSLTDSPRKIREVALVDETTVGITPESQGAAGDGLVNDTAAFQKLAALITASGGGVIELRAGANYLVGLQSLANTGTVMWQGQSVLTLDGLTRPLIIHGNGAKFTLASGLKFGTFDSSGNPTTHSLPYSGGDYSYPVPEAIISIKNCTALVDVSDIEVDGNLAALSWGGPYGDTGWQIPPDGFWFQNNSGVVRFSGLHGHHMPRDGVIVWGGGNPTNNASYPDASTGSNSVFEYNMRQGMSFVGGQGWKFTACKFNHTGRTTGGNIPVGAVSAPSAGVDLEAESGVIRDIRFENCQFIDNIGVGQLADSGDIRRISFERCRFIGTGGGAWALWVVKPWCRYRDCLIVGGMAINAVRAVGDYSTGDSSAPVFEECTFTDDTTYSPTGTIYTGAIINAGSSDLGFTRFKQCKFRGSYNVAMFAANGGYYSDCGFDIGSIGLNITNPNLSGHTTITGSVANIDTIFTGVGRWGSDITYGLVTTGNTHSNTTLDTLASTSGIVVGQTVTGTGIPSGTTVSGISGTTVTLSQAATATATGVSVTFSSQRRRGTATWDPPSIAAGARATTTVSVPWAKLRDIPKATASLNVQGLTLGAYVSTAASHTNDAGVVTVTLDNFTGGAVDLASLTVDVAVTDRELI